MADGFAQLKKDLAANNAARLYVFYGEESYLKAHYLNMLEKQCAGGFAEFNVIKLDGDRITRDSFTDAVESLPMGERKLVEIRDYPLGDGALREVLPSALAELPDYICLVFVYDGEFKPDKRLAAWKALEKNGQLVEFKRAGMSDLVVWLKRRFAALGKEISSADCEKMVFICGPLMTNLVTEVEKIAAATADKTVESKTIEKLASRSLEAGVFDLTDCLSAGKYEQALSVLHDLLDMKNSAVSIAAVLIKHLNRLYGAKLAMKAGLPTDEITSLLGFRSNYPTGIAMRSAESFSLARLRRAQELCLETDLTLKSNNPDDKRTLELLILRLASW